MMLLDRTIQPKVRDIEHLAVQMPQRFIMPNGVPLNILNSGDNEVVRIDLLIEGGRWHQSQPLQALFTNRMLREGTLRYSTLEIAEKLDYYGAWLELSSASEYAYITLYSLNKYLPQTLDVLESIVKEPTFPEKELGVVAENNIQQFIVNSSKVDFLAHRALMKAVYGGQHPCGRLVQKEDYKRITPDVLRKFYDRYYHSRNCTIYVSGKVGDDCVRRIEDLFGREAFGKGFQKPEKTDFVPVSSVDKRIFVEYADVMQSAVRMGMLSLERCHPDYLKARVMVTLFGGYFGDVVDVVSSTFFGKELTIKPLWFAPLNDPMRLLIYSMAFGLVHLFVGLGIKGYMLLKDGKVLDFFCDIVLWYIFLIGLILMLLPSEIFASIAQTKIVFPAALVTLSKAMAIIGALGLLLMSGRSSKNPALRLALGAYDIYNITGWLSDVLSYSRLLALGLATGVIASVVNQMGSMLGKSVFGVILFIVVFIVGHAMNLAINLLGAYVHTNRLQFVEFFGKFYEGGGKPFEPFHAETKYVDIKEETLS